MRSTIPDQAREAIAQAIIQRYDILGTARETGFDDLAFLASQVCQVPMALLGFFDHDRLWVKAQFQLDIDSIPRQAAWLDLSGEPGDILVVADAQADSRFAEDLLVRAAPSLRFIAGAPLVVEAHVIGALLVMGPAPRTLSDSQAASLRALAQQAVTQLELRRVRAAHSSSTARYEREIHELSHAYDATLESLARALDQRDREVDGHLQRVANVTVRLARTLGVPEEALPNIRRGVLLHDIGKMSIPDSVLLKPSALTEAEWAIMHQHPIAAYEMLAPITLLRSAVDIPYCHHERWDGGGYPRQLKGEAIPLAARIFAVVDVWDALRSDRPYRPGWPEDRVRDYIGKRAGADFDPRVVAAFLELPIS